jgi:transposase
LKWKELAKRLQTVPGIGPTLASILISELSELGNISNKEIASLVGVAPMNNDSGSHSGKRSTGGGGRKNVRRAIYMSTLSALTCNPAIKEYFRRLKNNGKPGMVKSGKTWQDFYRKA